MKWSTRSRRWSKTAKTASKKMKVELAGILLKALDGTGSEYQTEVMSGSVIEQIHQAANAHLDQSCLRCEGRDAHQASRDVGTSLTPGGRRRDRTRLRPDGVAGVLDNLPHLLFVERIALIGQAFTRDLWIAEDMLERELQVLQIPMILCVATHDANALVVAGQLIGGQLLVVEVGYRDIAEVLGDHRFADLHLADLPRSYGV